MKKLLFIFGCLVLLSTCQTAPRVVYPGEVINLQDVLAMAQVRREGIIRPSREAVLALVHEREAPTIDLGQLFSRECQSIDISYQEAIEDFTVFSDVIRQLYGAYHYFGGDEVFLPIFEEITNTLAAQTNWAVSDFAELIFDSLEDIITDKHFMINERHMGNWYDFFVPDNGVNAVFDRIGNRFRNRQTGLFVEDILFENTSLANELDSIFRLSMDSNGRFYYSIVIVRRRDAQTTANLTILYENGRQANLSVSPINPEVLPFEDSSLRYVYGFPIVTVRQMGFPDSVYGWGSEDARRFLAIAEELQDEPVVIVDIRSNGGGNATLPIRWLHILTGEIVPTNFWGVTWGWSYEDFISIVGDDNPNNPFHIPYKIFHRYLVPEPLGPLHFLRHAHEDKIVSNNQLLIILTDRWSGSGADKFTDLAFNLSNALVIGQNTFGALHTDMTFTRLYLPNSGMLFGFGTGIHLHPPGHLPEGIGIAPDIWVNGDALEAVLAMLNREF